MYSYIHSENRQKTVIAIENNNLTAGLVGAASTVVADAAGIWEVQSVLSAMVVGFSGALGGMVAKYLVSLFIKRITRHVKK